MHEGNSTILLLTYQSYKGNDTECKELYMKLLENRRNFIKLLDRMHGKDLILNDKMNNVLFQNTQFIVYDQNEDETWIDHLACGILLNYWDIK